MSSSEPTQSCCELCGEDHPTDQHPEVMRREARDGKRSFIVRVVKETRYRVWADDVVKAEDAVYWRRSSGRPYPEVEDLGDQPQRIIVDA